MDVNITKKTLQHYILWGPWQAPHTKNVPQKRLQWPANGPNEIYKPYLEPFYAFKTPVLGWEGLGVELIPHPRTE